MKAIFTRFHGGLVVAALLGFLGGRGVRTIVSEASESHPREAAPFHHSSAANLPRAGGPRTAPDGISLEEAIGLPNGIQRVIAAARAVCDASPAELPSAWERLIQDDPEEDWGQAGPRASSEESADQLLKLLVMSRWVELAPENAVEASGGHPLAWEAWVRLAPEAALEYSFGASSLRAWARSDPRAAFDWALDNQKRMMGHWGPVVQQMLAHHTAALDEAISGLPPGPARQEIVRAMVRALAKQDSARALEIARRTDDEQERAVLLSEIGQAVIDADPQAAMDLYRELAGSGVIPETETIRPLVEALARETPHETVKIAQQSGIPELLDIATQSWMRHDAETFGNWVDTLPPTERDPHYYNLAIRVTKGLSQKTVQEALREGAQWTNRIQSDELQTRAIDRLSQMSLDEFDPAYWEASERNEVEDRIYREARERSRDFAEPE